MAVLVILIALLYANLGWKLGKSPVLWAFAGVGVAITIVLLGAPFILLPHLSPDTQLAAWSMVNLLSLILAVILAFVIAHRKKLNLLSFKAR